MPPCRLFQSYFLYRLLSIIPLTRSSTVSSSYSSSLKPSISNHLQIPSNHTNDYSMNKKMRSGTEESSPSALRELKEIIAKQAEEIETLKLTIQANKSSVNAKPKTAVASSHGHGPPAAEEDPNEYIKTPFYGLAMKRVGWLFIFLMSLSLTAIIMNGFEHTLSKQIELAYFVPLLAGHGGNTGMYYSN